MPTIEIITLIFAAIAVLLIILFRPKANGDLAAIETRLKDLHQQVGALTQNLREDFKTNREESAHTAKQNRQELSDTLNDFRKELSETLRLITEQNKTGSDQISKTLDDKINLLNQRIEESNKANRQNISEAFKGFQESFNENVKSFNELQREKFGQLEEKQQSLIKTTETKLEQMRETVDEKLQKTLNERLGQSFEMVRGQLESVQKGLGEMQTLAQDVGGLKRVLSNVKMRGGFGEVQLQMLLENILAPEQFEANVITKKGSSERVEFAVKFPNKEGDRDYVWLPIDAKFPKDAYENLQHAYDAADPVMIESAQKQLENVIRKMAKDICEKYIDAPDTTNFGIMFLPFEGLFAEVVRKASLLEDIQRDCKVIITGPTTLAVILNSLQMGFRTLAIQKRSSEVWQILGAVKKEFGLFGGMLDKAQKNIETGLGQLSDVVGVRTRAIQKKLKGVEALSASETSIEVDNLQDLIENDEE
ncbi:MAG: DNA recombination protein RmuC [Flavisolibacter sp.]|jgi:DNA recombination protein RmuC|nr:DNA recombination protein RmuC [Flavisolibacter sp.]